MDFLLVLAVLLLVASVLLQLRSSGLWKLPQLSLKKLFVGSAPAPIHPLPADPAAKVSIEGRTAGHLKVLTHRELLQVTGAHQLLDHLARHSRLSKVTFERDFLPALLQYAEFVQLMPASESHHHANVGGLLAHTLETVSHALVLRGGFLLPRNGGAEIIDAQRDFWTYAIFFGALLHDVGKPLTDLRIEMRQPRGSNGTRWLPMSGSLVECGAEQYLVKFAPKAERDYGAHGKMGVVLLQRLVPASALSFLGRCPDVLQELTQFLGDDAKQGVIAEIIGKADQVSTKSNLSAGSRARFATARSIPLVERLMNAIQEMLRQGGQLPINRDGAVGWVYDGAMWFVAKRLADTVREYILARAGDEAGVPGESKNDRMFDTWQEYGQLTLNPATQQAIWHVAVHGEDGQGYCHNLSMLRFPLDKLWPDGASSYPTPMVGRVEVLAKRKADAEPKDAGAAPAPSLTPATTATGSASASERVPLTATRKDAPMAIPAPKFDEPQRKGGAAKRVSPTLSGDPDDYLPEDESARAAAHPSKPRAAAASSEPSQTISRHTVPVARPVQQATDPAQPEPVPRSAATAEPGPWEPPGAGEAVAPGAPIGRAVLHHIAPTVTAPAKGGREPSEAAVAFMRWVQQGLTEGSLKYNDAGAPVHFVEAGMALVSPAIFRDYASQFGEPAPAAGTTAAKTTGPERVGLSIQREVLRAGWHAPSPADGTNIWTFNVSRRGGVKTSKLSAVVLADSRKWVMEPPPPNATLQLPAAAKLEEPSS